jgi:hypothetical protein
LTWNLYHGRSLSRPGISLLDEFAAALAGWSWDVALLQEVPPWWPPALAAAAGAEARSVLTSRNGLLALRRAISSRNPDILKSNGGGANTILVRGPVLEHRSVRFGECAHTQQARTACRAGGRLDRQCPFEHAPGRMGLRDTLRALEWAPDGLLLFGGDINLRHPPSLPGLARRRQPRRPPLHHGRPGATRPCSSAGRCRITRRSP